MKTSAATSNHPSRSTWLSKGREAFRSRAWTTAYSALSEANKEQPLGAEDLLGLSIAAHLIGKDAESIDLLSQAHQGFISECQPTRAARCAFWLAYIAMFNGEMAHCNGWLSRCRRLLDGQAECAEHGYLLLPDAIRGVREGKTESALAAFERAIEIGERFADRELMTLALNGQGRALIRQGEIARGVTLLDEAMIAVTAGEVSPVVAGGVYCSVIESCRETFDIHRAQEWTSALDSWCAAQPDLRPYRGACLLHRAEIMQLHGEWPDALAEAERACQWLSHPTAKPACGAAYHRVAELHRLRGDFEPAELAFHAAKHWERVTRPGLALLRLAQGKLGAASTTIHEAVDAAVEPGVRLLALDAAVTIALAAKDLTSARKAASELGEIAKRHGAPFTHAVANRANGNVQLSEGDARGALADLRNAWNTFCELQAPYEAARARVLVALANRALGEVDTANSELAAARQVFRELGAEPDLAGAEMPLEAIRISESPLSPRELGVLKLVASGQTNRQIAAKLHISEKTVARHISNIFNKLDLSSRAAATAYAYQHGLA